MNIYTLKRSTKDTYGRFWSLLVAPIWHCILVVTFRGIKWFPATCRENVFVAFIPATQQNLACMRVFLLNRCIVYEANVIMHIKGEQRATLSSCLIQIHKFILTPYAMIQTQLPHTFYSYRHQHLSSWSSIFWLLSD